MSCVLKAENGCWLWLGRTSRQGYALVQVGGRWMGGHRAVYLDTHGGIPEGRQIHHRCRNPRCVNVNHLEALTPEEHLRWHRRFRRELRRRGKDYADVFLSENVDAIVHRVESGDSERAVAQDFGVLVQTVKWLVMERQIFSAILAEE